MAVAALGLAAVVLLTYAIKSLILSATHWRLMWSNLVAAWRGAGGCAAIAGAHIACLALFL